MPVITINDMNTIRNNLRVLASFDGLRGLSGKGARKLHINADGTFGTKDGLFQNIFQRGNEDSLLNADTIETIKRMFSSAINHMNNYTGADKQRDETRRLLFRGFRGLVYLAHHGYRTKGNYNRLQDLIEFVRDRLSVPLLAIIKKGLTDQLWFDSGVAVRKAASFTQSDFLEDTMGGICYGICMDWCRRVLIKNKFSFTTSSKQNEWDQLIRDVENYQSQKNREKIDTLVQGVLLNPDLTDKASKEAELKKQITPIMKEMNESIKANKAAITDMRFRKKSTYQALAQHTQKTSLPIDVVGQANQINKVSEQISLLQLTKLECEAKINGTYEETIQFGNITYINKPIFSDTQKDSFRKTILQIDNAVAKIGGSWPIMKSANKFSRMEMQMTDELNFPETTIMCISDPTDFQPHLAPIINRCINSMTVELPKAFYLSFSYNRAYAGIDKSGAHAMAFTKDPATNIFYAIDPNFGEFSSPTVDGLTFIFSILLSYYALKRNITTISTDTLSLTAVI